MVCNYLPSFGPAINLDVVYIFIYVLFFWQLTGRSFNQLTFVASADSSWFVVLQIVTHYCLGVVVNFSLLFPQFQDFD